MSSDVLSNEVLSNAELQNILSKYVDGQLEVFCLNGSLTRGEIESVTVHDDEVLVIFRWNAEYNEKEGSWNPSQHSSMKFHFMINGFRYHGMGRVCFVNIIHSTVATFFPRTHKELLDQSSVVSI